MTLIATKSWPKSVDVLTDGDLCFGSLKDNGRSCLLGYVARNFIPSLAANPQPLRRLGEPSIINALERSQIGSTVIQCLDTAVKEMRGNGILLVPAASIPDLNDNEGLSKAKRPTKFVPKSHDAYVARRQKEHLSNIARIWNRAMNLTGEYDCGEPTPLPRLFNKEDT